MDSRRFDALAKTVAAAPQSRRSAMRRVAGGLTAISAAAGFGPLRARAQEATPPASPAPNATLTTFLYIQSFAAGTLAPRDETTGTYELVLRGGTGQTTYFADRPERQMGIAPTSRVLAAVGFDPDDPPNAGLVAQTADGERVIIVELTNPRLDEANGTLTYDARPLPDYAEEALSHLAPKQSDEDLPATFGPATLFIDSGGCPYPICGGICCDIGQGMVCQGQGAYCVSVYQSSVCQGGDACRQHPHTTCNPEGTCYCGTDLEGGGACVPGLHNIDNICDRHACSTSGDCPYGKLCITVDSCCGSDANVCLALCQD